MTDYLQLAQQNAAPAEDTGENPYLPLARNQQQFQESQVRSVLELALKDDPEMAAERQRLSQTSGIPLRVVERNMEELRIKERARAVDLLSMAQESPVLYRQLLDPTFATTSVDDLDTLKSIERVVGGTASYLMGARPDGGIVGDLKGSIFRSAGAFAGAKRAVVDVIEPWARLVQGDQNLFAEMSKNYAEQAKGFNASADQVGSKIFGVSSGVQSLGQNLKYMPMALAGPGGAAAALGGMVMESFGTSYNKAAGKNLPLWQSLGYASADAMVEYWTEKIPLDALVGGIKQGAPFIQTLAKQMALEIPGEQLATVLQDLNEWATINPGKPFKEYLAERPSAAAETLIATVIGTGGNVMVSSGLSSVLDTVAGNDWRDNLTSNYQQMLDEQLKLAGQSLFRERSPEQFRTHIQNIVNERDGAPKEVYVDGEVLNQLPVEVLNQLPESVRNEIPIAAQMGKVVAIPMADVLTVAPGTALEQVLNQHARMDPFAETQAEAQLAAEQAQERIAQDTQRIIQQASDQTAARLEYETVKGDLAAQITATGRYSPAVSDAYAAGLANFFVAYGERTGQGAAGLYQAYRDRGFRIVGERTGQGSVLADGQRLGALNVEGYHFSKEARPVVTTGTFGTGLAGSNRDQYLTAEDKRLRKRAYFYADKGTGINPEAGVGGIGHRANLTNIYDADADPLRLRKGGQLAFESAVLDAGFSGYLSRLEGTQSGQVVLLGDQAVQTEVLGPTQKTNGKVVPAPAARESKGRDLIVDALNADATLPSGSPTIARWQELLAKNPEVLQALTDAGVFAGDQTENVYKSDLIKRFEEATPAESYAQSLSSRLPSAVKATEDPLSDVLNISYDTVLSDLKTLEKNVAALRALPNMRKLTGKGAKDTVKNAEAFIDHVVNNLLWLHDHMPKDMRDRAHLWYDGGRKTIETWANRYGISEMQGAAAIAVLSPQNGWFANVSQAERIADMVFGLRDFTWDDAMTAEATRISSEDGLDPRMQAAVGKTLGELLATPDIAARWARVYDQTYNNRAYRVLTPEGGAADYVKTGAGADATMMWKSYSTIAKAISVFMDGRAENVHYQLGKEHKVRNFYNNLFDPKSERGYATIDTHAVAAALLRPLASADIEVAQAFGGGGSASSNLTGLNGTYPIYLEAYRRAAEARGILPREMQSITWEAVRGLFEAAKKSGLKAPANAIWTRYKKGEIDQQQAQKEILELAGDITPPSWTSVPFNDQPSRTYEGPAQKAIDERGDVGKATPPNAKVMFEVAPDPNDAALAAEWDALPSDERLRISQEVAAQVVPKVLKELGTDGDFVMQLGGYLGATNPSMTLRLARPELSLTAAKLLGYALAQDSMMVVTENQVVGSDEVGAVTIQLPDGYGETEVAALYDRLWELEHGGEKLIGGHTTADGQMVILNYSPLSTEELAAMIDTHLGGQFEIATNTVYSAFPSKEDYGYASDQPSEGDAAPRKSLAQRRPDSLRAEAAQLPREALDARRADAGAYAQGEVNGRPEQAGDGAGRYSSGNLAPLEGAPAVEGAAGPDSRLVAVAEQYARDNGITLRRQAEYVKVDTERAARIAAAYEAMPHAPQDPAVKEAYANLIQQTVAQYRALEAAGYKFYFFDESNDPYQGNPWNAMRDLRTNQTMGVFATEAGFGSGATELNVDDNPLLGDTGITWPYGALEGEAKRVLANDLFRAVHDAFGHGLEGSGFRAQGEENAWQAHVRLFTGSAVGAITTETRGQNSWLNYGPHGEANQAAKVEDTVFADQKTGLLPEWAWTEGRAANEGDALSQGPRGTFSPSSLELVLNPNANLSTLWHEMGHFFLEVMADVATQPGAPAQIMADYQTFLKWAGVTAEEWAGFNLDQKRAYHERWAETVEQYIMEGKVPNVELQPLLRRFRSWMLSVYQSIQKFLADKPDAERMPLNEDIRRVLDRMLATDAQIAQAEEVAGMVPNEEATAEATERLEKRSMRDLRWTVRARDAAIRKLQKQAKEIRKGIEAQVTAEVEAMPVYAARLAMRNGNKIDSDALAEMYMGEGDKYALLDWKALTDQKLAGKDGTHPDVLADMFGFQSGDALVHAILGADPMVDVIEGMTEQRMLEEHGDLVDERAVQEAANEAVHNEARARALATELRSQAEMLGARTDTGETNARGAKITTSTLMEAAKQFAANVVARTPLRDLKNRAWQHTAAERRAAKRWQEATAAGKTEEAVKAKQDQVLNNAAAKAALDAKAEMGKILEFFKRVIKDGNEATVDKGRDPDVVNAARAILAAYGVKTNLTKRAAEYMDTLAKNDPAMHGALQPYVEGALQLAQPLEALTFEELQALNDTIAQMWYLAKRSRQMEVDGKLLDLADAEAELQDRMQAIGVPLEVPGESGALTAADEARRKLQFAGSLLRRVEQWAEGIDGKFGGPFLRLVFQPVKDAADRYRADRVVFRKKYQALVDKLAPALTKGLIEAPELGYTFGKGHNGIGHAELVHAILHTGNESNKRKLLLGRKWATENADGTLDTSRWDAFLQRAHDTGLLTQAHYDFAQGVWDLLEETKPMAQKAHRDVFGRYFDEVTADSFETPFGVYRGGYVPAQADPRIVQDADLRKMTELENENMSFSFPTTNKGFTKGRVEYNRPLMLDLRTIGQHLDKVLLFSHMEPAVRDVNKLLTRKGVAYSLGRIDPTIYSGMLTPWLNRSARQVVETPIVGDGGVSRMLSAARSRAGMALMFANISNTIQQLTGFTMAFAKIKSDGLDSHMMRATAGFIASPKKMASAVAAASPFMEGRMENEIAAINDAMDDILLDPNAYEKAQAWTRKHAYFLQSAMANTMEPIIWTAGYNGALEKGMSDSDAVRYADGLIRQTQGSTLPEDVSRIETGPAYARMFTQFIGYFNMMANTNATALKQISSEIGLKKGAGKALAVVTMGLLVPIWISEAIAQAMRGGPDDEDKDGYLDDWLAAVFGFGTLKGSLAMVPFVGQLANAAINRFNGNPADDKMSLSPAVSLLESAVGVPVDVYKAIANPDKLNKRNAVRDVASAVSITTGLPAVAVARPLGYLAGVADDRIEPTGPVDMARGLATGSASPESKQR